MEMVLVGFHKCSLSPGNLEEGMHVQEYAYTEEKSDRALTLFFSLMYP